MANDRPTKNERRAQAREKARQLREEQKRRERRNRLLWQGGIVAAILAVAAVVAVVIVVSIKPPAPAGPGPKNMISDGIVIGKDFNAVQTAGIPAGGKPTASTPTHAAGTVRIVTYIDYLCPFCGEFERTNDAQIGDLVKSGAATVEIHPLSLITHVSGNPYSAHAANAAACVANYDPNRYWEFNLYLFNHQPEETATPPGLSALKKAAKEAGVTELSKVNSCISKGTFDDWVEAAYKRWLNDKIPNSDFGSVSGDQKGTPIIVVNGKTYRGSLTDANAFRSFVVAAQSQSDVTGSTAPTAPATPTTPAPETTAPAGSSTPEPRSTAKQ